MKLFSLIFSGDVHPSSNKKIIPQEEFSTLLEAKELVEKAHQDAEQLIEKTKKDCEKLKKTAKEKGFNEGLAQFNQHLVDFDAQLKKISLEMQNAVLPLSLKAAKKIVGEQLRLHPETIVDIVIQALAPLRQNRHITIYVNKEEKDLVESNKPKIKEILEHVQTLMVKERSDVSPGGCIIETEAGIINATLENQWRALEAAFEKFMKR